MTPFFRFRAVLQATHPLRLPAQQGAILYALICRANQPVAEQQGANQSFPRELMIDVPEVCRTQIPRGEPFAFGGTILANDSSQATALLNRLISRLDELGREGRPRTEGLGGNYRLEVVQDLVDGEIHAGKLLEPVAIEHLNREIQQLQNHDELTLLLQSPVRIERPRRQRKRHRICLDDRYFHLPMLIRMLVRRMDALGIRLRQDGVPPTINEDTVHLLAKQILWLELNYGGRHSKKLGGIVGRIHMRVTDPAIKAALVWGQYTRLGKNTAFGFGRYRIAELGPEPFECSRAVPLLETAWRDASADRVAAQSGLEAGVLNQAVQQVREGSYQPDSVHCLRIGSGETARTLQIPSRRDRSLQRLVLSAIAPAMDSLMESSSFAWRKGLGRHSSAKAIQRAWKNGFRFAVNADFDRFFESINHRLLENRLHCYLHDSATVSLIMAWVRQANVSKDQGIPTGSPISPLLGNLLLDRFDEIIAERGGRLIRYGDDFLILSRDQETAFTLFQTAKAEAEQLQLTLNETEPEIIDFDESFRFLGFDFVRHEKWVTTGREPRLLEELGWHDASQKRPRKPLSIKLPGETGRPASDFGLTAIVGPEASHLELRPDVIGCHYRDGRPQTFIPLADLEILVVLGNIGTASVILRKLMERQVHVILADDAGHAVAAISGDHDLSHEVLTAQVDASRSAAWTLTIAQQLVGSKIHNYARLAAALAADGDVADRLQALADKTSRADNLDSLRGLEGAAAAVWYGRLSDNLGRGFHFETRVAPNAEDPVNVLLNIAHMQLYRLTLLAVRSAGLCSSLGFLHAPTGRYAALASDLQECFRFLMDRCVIEATQQFHPRDFVRDDSGTWPLKLKRSAVRKFHALVWRTLHREVHIGEADEAATSYLVQIQRLARRLRRHLLHPENKFKGIRLP